LSAPGRSVGRFAAALGVILTFAFLPGSAFAAPGSDTVSWSYPGSTTGSQTVFSFTYLDKKATLQHFFLLVNGSTPSAIQWSNLAVTVNGTEVPNACLALWNGNAAGVECQFAHGTVEDGATIALYSDASPAIAPYTGGTFLTEDWNDKPASIPIAGPWVSTSPDAFRSTVLTAELTQHSVRYVTVGPKIGAWTIQGDVARDRGIQRLTVSLHGKARHVTIIVIGSTAYLHGDASALHWWGFPPSFVSRYAGRWVAIPHGSRWYPVAAVDVTLGSWAPHDVPRTQLSFVSGALGKTAMRGLRGTAPEGGVLTTYVPATGPPLPVEALEVYNNGTTHTIQFSHWNEAVNVKAPAHAVRIH
jgi:hypothetical protein